MLLLTAPVYYTIWARGSAVTGRMDDSGIGSSYFSELAADGIGVQDLLDIGNRVGMPLILYVAAPPWSEDPAMNPGWVAGLFLIGVAFLLWRIRTPAMLILGWMLATSLGNALLRESTSQFRYTVVWNTVIIALAVGVRYLIPILLPVGERWIERARTQLFARRTLQVGRALPIALAGIVGFAMAWYYFVPYLTFYNAELRGTKGYRDGIDVALRSVDLPPDTDIYLIGRPEHDQTVPSNFLALLTNNARGLSSNDTHEMGANVLMRLPRDRNYAFFVEPDDTNYINLIRRYFPNVEPPVYSTYPYIPPGEEYVLLFAPQSDYTPPVKK